MGSTGSGPDGRVASLDQAPAGEPQEHVLEAAAAHQDRLRLDTAMVQLADRPSPASAVEQHPVGQHLDPLTRARSGRSAVRRAPRPSRPAPRSPRPRTAARRPRGSTTARISASGRPLGGDPPAVHDDQPVAELLGLVHVVRGEDEGDAARLSRNSRSQTTWRACGSRPVVGSSSSSRSGSLTSDRAIVRRRFIPPDSVSTRLFARSLELHELEQLAGPLGRRPARQPEVAPVDDEVLPDRQLDVEAVLLRHDAEPRPDLRPSTAGSMPEHPQRARR